MRIGQLAQLNEVAYGSIFYIPLRGFMVSFA